MLGGLLINLANSTNAFLHSAEQPEATNQEYSEQLPTLQLLRFVAKIERNLAVHRFLPCSISVLAYR